MPQFKNLSLPIQVQYFIEKEKLLLPGQSVLCAVSGGLDSMVLVKILLELNYKPSIAHFNFGLRGNESDLDEELVKNWANKNHVPFFRDAVLKDHFEGKSIQEEARKLRYNWFTELASWQNINAIALAHHADDQIETIFLQLLRGTGLAGMRGMLPKQEKLIRPLLFAHKNELQAFALEHNLEWREDASNLITDYKRNKIRLKMIPMLEEISPGFQDVMLRNMERVRLHEEVSAIHFHQLEKMFLTEYSTENQIYNWEKIKNDPSGRFFIMEFLRLHLFNFSMLDEIWNSTYSSECRQWKNENGLTIELKGNRLLFWLESYEPILISIPGPGLFQIGKNRFFKLKLIETEPIDFMSTSQYEVFVDLSKINFPCKLTNWQAGDHIETFGLKGKKKSVSDLLTDKKMSLEAKKRVLKLEDAQNKIIWLVGIEQSFHFRIENSANKIAQVVLKENRI